MLALTRSIVEFAGYYQRCSYFADSETTCSSETSVVTKPTRRHIPEQGNIHSHRRENLKVDVKMSYIYFKRIKDV
jgi:hypothetical protein